MMRTLILASAATLALGIAGCQRQPQQEEAPAGESAAPLEQEPMDQTAPGQQPGEAPDTQEEVIPQDDTSGAQPMEDQSSPGLGSGTESSGQEPQSAPAEESQ